MGWNIYEDKRRGYHSIECGDSEPQSQRISADEENGAGCWTATAPPAMLLLALLFILLARLVR